MALLIFYLLLALVVSFICSMMESVLLSTPVSFLKVMENQKQRGARRMLKVRGNIDQALAAILSLNTIAHTVGAAGVGAQTAKVFGNTYVGMASAILTVLILVFTEILPKSIGIRYWRQLAGSAGAIIQSMIYVAYPFVIVSAWITRLVKGKGDGSDSSTSREEMSALMGIATEEGIFEEDENTIFQNILRLKEIRTSDVMTPRTVAVIASEQMPLSEFIHSEIYRRFSRIPIYADQNPDHITGYIFSHAAYELAALEDADPQLKELKRDIIVVAETWPVMNVWKMMLEKKEHIALVVDQYGGMAGLITMEDVIETLLGIEIVDEKDIVTDMQELARERWMQRQKRYPNLATLEHSPVGKKR